MGDDPDMLVVLTTARTEFEGQTLAEALRARGVPAEVFATAASSLQWEAGFTDPIKVMVRRADVERASQIRASIKADSVDIDWDEVDTGVAGRIEDERARMAEHEAPRRRSMLAVVWKIGLVALSLLLALIVLQMAGTMAWAATGDGGVAWWVGLIAALGTLCGLWLAMRKR